MGIRELRARFRGREFWRGFNRFLGIGLYTVLLVGVMVFPRYLGYLILGYIIVIPSYIAFFINHLREREKQGQGKENKLIKGWVTHGYGVGEPVYFYPTKFEVIDKLSPDDLKAVTDYVQTLTQYSATIESGLDRFKKFQPQQLTYKKVAEIDAMNKEDREKFDEMEKQEHESHVKDHKEVILEQNKKNKIITIKSEDESTNE